MTRKLSIVSILVYTLVCCFSEIDDPNSKVLVFPGRDGDTGGGIGNFLVFWPAVYFFSFLTNRKVVILDRTVIGQLCLTLKCKFALVSEEMNLNPFLFQPYNVSGKLKLPKCIETSGFHAHLSKKHIFNNSLISVCGFKDDTFWWMAYSGIAANISSLTGCNFNTSSYKQCIQRYAMNELIHGPLRLDLSKWTHELERFVGFNRALKTSIFTQPHNAANGPHVAIHLRAQLSHFEVKKGVVDDKLAGNESIAWANSAEALSVFSEIRLKLLTVYEAAVSSPSFLSSLPPPLASSMMFDGDLLKYSPEKTKMKTYHRPQISSPTIPFCVYVASDNDWVKKKFISYLRRSLVNNGTLLSAMSANVSNPQIRFQVMYRKTAPIPHSKFLYTINTSEHQRRGVVVDMILDWYLLSLSDVMLVWRRNTPMVSTYAQSALRMGAGRPRDIAWMSTVLGRHDSTDSTEHDTVGQRYHPSDTTTGAGTATTLLKEEKGNAGRGGDYRNREFQLDVEKEVDRVKGWHLMHSSPHPVHAISSTTAVTPTAAIHHAASGVAADNSQIIEWSAFD